jgi:hypothetical protein
VYQIKKRIPIRVSSSLFRAPRGKGLEQSNATVRWTVAADGLMEANLYLLPLGADANESLPVYQNKKADTHLGIRFLVWRYAWKGTPTIKCNAVVCCWRFNRSDLMSHGEKLG